MMTKFPNTRIAATCSKKAGNGLTDPRRKKGKKVSWADVAFYFMPGAGSYNLVSNALAPHSKNAVSTT
jgi:hypothetical protein